MWDSDTYLRFGGERARPFVDLLAQVHAVDPRFIADLGCGPGNLTELLAHRWPRANAVLQWYKGTGLWPVLAALSPAVADQFIAEYATRIRSVYPARHYGTVLPFRRVFVVAHR